VPRPTRARPRARRRRDRRRCARRGRRARGISRDRLTMDAHAIVAALGIYAGAFAVGAISSVIPIVSIDVFVVAITLAAGAGPEAAVPVAPPAAAGRVAGKRPIYAATRGLASRSERIERLRARLARWQRAPHLVLATSALLGLPPFSIVATAAGALAIRLRA